MSRMTWKYCFVLSCLNNSKNNPDKYYFRVPYNKSIRDKWCIAVDRATSSIKQSSTAYCCSDHFDMEEDLDLFESSSGSPKLKFDVVPSLKHIDTQARNAKAMEVIDIFGPDVLNDESTTKDEQPPSDNIYIREVVYIEENDNDQFLQENVESEVDCLNVGSGMETQAVVEISDDKQLLGAVASAIKTLKPTESLKQYKIPPKSLAPEQLLIDKNKDVTGVGNPKTKQCKSLNEGIANQSNVVLKQDKGPVAANTKNSNTFESKDLLKFNGNERTSTHPRKQVFLKCKNSQPLNGIEQLTVNTKSTFQIKNVISTSTAKPKTTVPSKSPVRYSGTPANELMPTQKVVNRFKYTNHKEFTKLQSQLNAKKHVQSDDDDCILLDEPSEASKATKVTATDQNQPMKMLARLPKDISVKEFSNVQMTSSSANNAIMRVQPQPLRVREFLKIDTQGINHEREFKLIQLIISENPSLVNCNSTNRIKISRTKPNEFKILDDIYYYRTNEIYEKNYFFMNITRISRHGNEIIQRNYGIYWGDPRVSCVGVVETKGVLDEETKNFVFQQVKKSLFDEDGQQHVKLVNVIQHQPIKPIRLQRSVVPTNILATNKSNEVEIIKIDDETDGPVTTILNSIEPPHNTEKSTSHKLTGNSQMTEVFQNEHKQNSELINLYNHLSPATRKLINKLKYFEMYNGFVYTVTVGPKYILMKDKPFNLIFTKNSKDSNIKPAPKELFVSKLVNDIFKAIYPNPLSSRSQTLSSPPILQTSFDAVNSIPAYPPKKAKLRKKPFKALSNALLPYDMTHRVKMLTTFEQAQLGNMSHDMSNMERTFKLPSGKIIKIAKTKPGTKVDSFGKSIMTPASVHPVNLPLHTIHSMSVSDVPQQMSAHNVVPVKNPSMVTPTSPLRSKVSDVRDEVTTKVNTPQLCVMLPSTKTDNLLTDKTKKRKGNKKICKKKHSCCFCTESFDRSYQLKRHLFVKHNSNKTSDALSEGTKDNAPSTLVVSMNYTQKDQPNPEMPDQENFTNDLKPFIKKENEEDAYLDEKSLLVPLFEEKIKSAKNQSQNCQDDFLLVKCKEEPEECFEEVTEMPDLLERLPEPPEPPEKKGRKRKASRKRSEMEINSASKISSKVFDEESKKHSNDARKQSHKRLEESTARPVLLKSRPALLKIKTTRKVVEKHSDEETDSAPESSAAIRTYNKNFQPMQRKRTSKIVKRSRLVKIPKVNKRCKKPNRQGKKGMKKSFVVSASVKISDAMKFMTGWSTPTVNLVDLYE